MSPRALVVLVSLLFASLSCTDNNVTEVKSPTGPSAAAPKASANAAAPFVITAATSSICRVMVKAHDDARLQRIPLRKTPISRPSSTS